jgi:hypothetical protein
MEGRIMGKLLVLYFPRMKTFCCFVANFSLFVASVVHSAQDAHVHGLSHLTIALEKQTLLIEINSPLMDIVGFEGEPRTKVQKDSIERAKATLRKIDNVLIFKGGSCLEKNIDVTLGHDHSNEHSHSEHDHDTHSEISAVYKFKCLEPEELQKITVLLPNQFSRMEKIKTQWVTSDAQGQITLDKNKNTINLK